MLAPLLPPALATLYALWQGYNYVYWRRASRQSVHSEPTEWPRIAVVVPFRNEAATLPYLLASLKLQDYPRDRYEIILVDDHSTEEGGAAGEKHLTVLQAPDTPTVAHKKAALTRGITHTTAELIVTTDADCRWPRGGLRQLARHYADGADAVLGPVLIAPVHDFCSAFQSLDVLGYQLFTAATVSAGTPALANGAHFAFRRSAFERVGGYAGMDHLPSGDDVLLLHKFVAAGLDVRCSTDTTNTVKTRPEPDWPALWRQRLRWAGKSGEYGSPALQLAQGLAYLTSLGIVVGLIWGLLDEQIFAGALLAWLVKGAVDYVLLREVAGHYGQQRVLAWYGVVQLLYPFYLVAVGTAALLGLKMEWKGRPG